MAQMTAEQIDTFLQETRIATLVSLHAGGAPTAVPVWFEWDGRMARVFTNVGSEKVKRIRADGRVSLSVAEPVGAQEAWVTIEGTASIESEGGIELARRLLPRYYSAERAAKTLPEWEQVADQWVVVSITPRRIRSMAAEA